MRNVVNDSLGLRADAPARRTRTKATPSPPPSSCRPSPSSLQDATCSAPRRPAPARPRPSRCRCCNGSLKRTPAFARPGTRCARSSSPRPASSRAGRRGRAHLRPHLGLRAPWCSAASASAADRRPAPRRRHARRHARPPARPRRAEAVDLRQVEILVLDEADRMLDMGFIHDIRRILALLPERARTCCSPPPSPTRSASWRRRS